MDIGKSIRVFMAKNNIKRLQIAESLSVTEAWVSTIANDKRLGLNRVQELADLFGVPVSEFIKAGEDDKKT